MIGNEATVEAENLRGTNETRAKALTVILDEQRDAHARALLTLTRELDRLQCELNAIKIERGFVWIFASIFLFRLKRNQFLHRILSQSTKEKFVRLLRKVGF